MANPGSLASGLSSSAASTVKSSSSLYHAIKDPQPNCVPWNQELEASHGGLLSLKYTVGASTDVDLSALDLPLLEQKINKCSSVDDIDYSGRLLAA